MWIFFPTACCNPRHMDYRLNGSSHSSRLSQNCEKRLLALSCPSVRKELGSHWKDFYEIWYMSVFRRFVEEIYVSLKSYKNNGYFTWRPTYIYYNISLYSSQNEKHVTQNLYTKPKHVLCLKTFSRNACRLSDNVEKYRGARDATWHNMKHALLTLDN
jgi:hypothetical protein